MERKDVELAIQRYQAGDRPFPYRRPTWHLVSDSGALLPLKYIYGMVNGDLNPHTNYAKKAFAALGYAIVELNGAEQEPTISEDHSVDRRLPAEQLRKVTAEHIWNAVQFMLAGGQAEFFGPSSDYDLLVEEGIRLAPKQVFGLAASDALGLTIKPTHFTAGVGTVCFDLLKEAGYKIVPKDLEVAPVGQLPTDIEEREWAEGRPALVYHLRRERATGLAKAKKAEFLRKHGKLFCEDCRMDPSEIYGDIGDSCIEVHHHTIHVAKMSSDHKTTLEDLRCLCANCHRIEHRRLRSQTHEAAQ